jgi:hypothetical protein
MSPDDDKQSSSGGQGGGADGSGGDGGGPKSTPSPDTLPVRNPEPPRSDPGGVSVRWEIPKPWKRPID